MITIIDTFMIILVVVVVDCGKHIEEESYVGSGIILKCPFEAENSSMQWFRIDSQIVYSNGKSINPTLTNTTTVEIAGNCDVGECHLLISSLRKDDEGIYRCSGYSEGVLKYKIISLKVLDQMDVSTTNSSDIHSESVKGFHLHQYLIIYISVIISIYGLPLVTLVFAKKCVTYAHKRRNLRQTIMDHQGNPEDMFVPYNVAELQSFTHETISLRAPYEDIDIERRPTNLHNTDVVTEGVEQSHQYQDLDRNLYFHCYEELNLC